MRPVLLLACLALSAPAPLPHPPRPLQVTPGEWVLEWDGAAVPCTLGEDGTYSWGDSFRGVWSWEPRTRTLNVVEWLRWTPEREYTWSVRLDARLESIDQGKPGVRLWKKGRGP